MVRIYALLVIGCIAVAANGNPARVYTPAVTWSPSAETVVAGAQQYAYQHSPDYQNAQTEIARLNGVIEGMRLAQGVVPYDGHGGGTRWTEGQPQTLDQALAERDYYAEALARAHECNPPKPGLPPQSEVQPQASILMSKCSSCHSGNAPKAGFIIEPGIDFSSDEAALKVVKILRKAYNGEMPIDGSGNPHPLTDDEYGQLEAELLLTTD